MLTTNDDDHIPDRLYVTIKYGYIIPEIFYERRHALMLPKL